MNKDRTSFIFFSPFDAIANAASEALTHGRKDTPWFTFEATSPWPTERTLKNASFLKALFDRGCKRFFNGVLCLLSCPNGT